MSEVIIYMFRRLVNLMRGYTSSPENDDTNIDSIANKWLGVTDEAEM